MLDLDLQEIIGILNKTPKVLRTLIYDLPETLIFSHEGKDTWSTFDIVGHLIHGKKTDWIPRTEIILGNSNDKLFEPFDRFAQINNNAGKSIHELLDDFEDLREINIMTLESFNITKAELQLIGNHPEFGAVTLAQLLSTWAVHDLGHMAQINRVLAKQFTQNVGPWKKYLPILD